MGKAGVGMPASIKLEQFGELVAAAFDGEIPYRVGSSIATTAWRDVDVRLILDDEQYAAMGFGDPADSWQSEEWVALSLAFSALGRDMTGLPIDFQIQQRTEANAKHNGPRSALLGMRTRYRWGQEKPEHVPSGPSTGETTEASDA